MPTPAPPPAKPPAARTGAPRPEASTHAPAAHHGALQAWLCALLTALIVRLEPVAHLFPGTTSYPNPGGEPLAAETLRAVRAAIRAANRLRAWIGWILRFAPNRAMRRTFARLAPPAPLLSPRAPPHPA